MKRLAAAGIAGLCVALAGCGAMKARDNLDEAMQAEVGRTKDDPQSFRGQHPRDRISTQRLRNGNTVEEYQVGFRQGCRVYFEIDKDSQQVKSWRYGASDADCISGSSVGASKPK